MKNKHTSCNRPTEADGAVKDELPHFFTSSWLQKVVSHHFQQFSSMTGGTEQRSAGCWVMAWGADIVPPAGAWWIKVSPAGMWAGPGLLRWGSGFKRLWSVILITRRKAKCWNRHNIQRFWQGSAWSWIPQKGRRSPQLLSGHCGCSKGPRVTVKLKPGPSIPVWLYGNHRTSGRKTWLYLFIWPCWFVCVCSPAHGLSLTHSQTSSCHKNARQLNEESVCAEFQSSLFLPLSPGYQTGSWRMTTLKYFLLRVQELSEKNLQVSQHCSSVHDDQRPKQDSDIKTVNCSFIKQVFGLCLWLKLLSG